MASQEENNNLGYTYTQETSLHGIGRVASRDRSLLKKTIWALVFLGCSALFLFFFSSSIIKYFNYPVNTKLTYTTQAVLDFPSVTICNYNQMNASYLAMKNDPMLNQTSEFLSSIMYSKELPTPDLLAYMTTLESDTFYMQGAHKAEETFMSCQYIGIQDAFMSCDLPDGMLKNEPTQMGMCQTFNPQSYIAEHGPLPTTRAGSTGGLMVMINIAQYEYYMGMSMAGGVKVLVHDPKVRPRVFELGIALSPGTEANLVVMKQEMATLPYPFTRRNESCLETEAQDFKNPLKYHEYYSYAACVEEETVKSIIKQCECVFIFFKAPGERNCNMFETITCAIPAIENFYTNTTLMANCKKPCNEVQYEVTVSQSTFPNSHMVKDLMKTTQMDEEFFRDNIIMMNVFFGELGYTKIEQEQGYTVPSAFAEIGGYMGLCLGASILTVFELAELFWDYCARWKKHTGKRRNTTPVQDLELGYKRDTF